MAELHLLSPKGFRAAGVTAGIKASGKPDVAMLVADDAVPAAAVFTSNKVVAAPVIVGRDNIASGKLRAIVVNSGNANACTGKQGLKDAARMCVVTADAIGSLAGEVLPSSTGVIGRMLPMDKVETGIRDAASKLGDSAEHALAFGTAIMTTDAFRKHAALTVKLGRQTVTLAGVAKGAGMIGPRLATGPKQATMLVYLTTDAAISSPALRKLLIPAINRSFNACTVDDHTSTNDTVAILASGQNGAKVNTMPLAKKFGDALAELCVRLAKKLVSDGEGATKVVTVNVTGAKSPSDATKIARAIANSPLVKCAMHGNDPNWGRIVSAAGYCGAAFDPDKAVLVVQGTPLFRKGQPLPFDAKSASGQLKASEVSVHLACGLGKAFATVYGCDLSKEYVSINADYTT